MYIDLFINILKVEKQKSLAEVDMFDDSLAHLHYLQMQKSCSSIQEPES
jgi:hypothetical protein